MLNIKKALVALPIGLLAIPLLTSCNNSSSGSKDGTIYLKVLNSEDYIYKNDPDEGCEEPDLTEQFENYMLTEHGMKVKVIYDTFDTMENMYNTLKTGKTQYDVICASEYMIQKLASSNLIEPLEQKNIPNYFNNDYDFDVLEKSKGCSPFIREKLQSMPIIAGKSVTPGDTMDDYAVCYMWGTLGILYNPTYKAFSKISEETVHEDMKDWGTLWNSKYKKTISIKDSMRDTYCIGLMHTYKDELANAKTIDERNRIFNYGGEADKKAKEHINTIRDDLLKLRNNVFGFEVDSGKQDIVTGKIGIDTAWSGDAVYSMNQGDEEESATLYYSIPTTGTNLWFDCWCMQKGANKDIANYWLDFISDSENACKNMYYIGYTSPIAGQTTFNYFKAEYDSGVEEDEDYNIGYFYNKSGESKPRNLKIPSSEINRQIAAQFPNEKVINNLMIMQDYGANNDLILRMWEQVKHESLPNWAIALLSVEGAIAVGGVVVIVILKTNDKRRRKNRRARHATA